MGLSTDGQAATIPRTIAGAEFPVALGNRLSALDIYLATFLTPIVGVTEQECPGMMPQLRSAFANLTKEVGHAVTEALAAHRATVFERHLVRPIEL